MKEYIKLMRPKHYLKNGLILFPLLFSGLFTDPNKIYSTILAFISFSLIASAVYIFNDLKDREKDKLHEVKKNRPIASGKIGVPNAICFGILLLVLSLVINYFAIGFNLESYSYLLIYFGINILYSIGLKNIPLIDVSILTFGFLLRVMYGATIIDIEISSWLYLTIMAGAFYLGLGKRRNEIIKSKNDTRKVLQFYTKEFLDKNMYSCLTLAIVFYSLWTVDPLTITRIGSNNLIWTVPFVLVILMKYSLTVEKDNYGDPVDVILSDKVLIIISLIYAIVMLSILYM